ncbi:hypothetical protein PS876_02578 [Pseudomonas fluorescens]|nr:hypothetical protein PS876_02578 [Pseudomonas fluorescens]
MDSVKQNQVGVPLQHPPISPLSLRERAGVRGFFLDPIKKGSLTAIPFFIPP